MPGLRDILDAATSKGTTVSEVVARIEAQEWIDDHAPELAALCLDMGEALRTMSYWDVTTECMRCPLCESKSEDHDARCPIVALLARLDRIGKEPGDE